MELSKYSNQSIKMAKLETIKLKLFPKNPIWISSDARIQQTIPPVPLIFYTLKNFFLSQNMSVLHRGLGQLLRLFAKSSQS